MIAKQLEKVADIVWWYIIPPLYVLTVYIDSGFTTANIRIGIEIIAVELIWASYRLWWHKYISPF